MKYLATKLVFGAICSKAFVYVSAKETLLRGADKVKSVSLGEQFPPSGCSSSADCSTGDLCKFGVCIPDPKSLVPSIEIDTCAADSDCSSGMVCIAGYCAPDVAGIMEDCTTDDDCEYGIEKCINSLCLPIPTPPGVEEKTFTGEQFPPSGCSSSADCSTGDLCKFGVCIPDPQSLVPSIEIDTCAADSDCSSGMVCIAGYCAPDVAGIMEDCTTDDDCEYGIEKCINSLCLPIPTPPGGK